MGRCCGAIGGLAEPQRWRIVYVFEVTIEFGGELMESGFQLTNGVDLLTLAIKNAKIIVRLLWRIGR